MWTDSTVLIAIVLVTVAMLWTASGESSMNYYQRDAQKGLWQR
ncbi:hypothetical protein [Mycobacteroides saopaulense]|uniref:Uncharacterized protein n=1 Tax=Mycobacteroides saopaulense TaxID=1578165 RepID=A0ABX3BT31_9MYCO|nr:hypothetical protein [Mycobacteroides saopaulense]OHT82486.1 hypothetical protein BKG68_21080 [Mycobacteroides saopaulense]OHU01869.1 hypothetical protein BKG73_24720 [Mycobacteroides saopaulense]